MVAALLIFMLSACGERYYGDYKYSDFEAILHWDDLQDLGHDDYELVYIYNRDFLGGETTGTKLVNEDLFAFGKENALGLELYRLNLRDVSGVRAPGVQRRDPKVLVVRFGEVADKFYGAAPIFSFLEAVEQDRYVFPDLFGKLDEDDTHYGDYRYSDFDHIHNWRTIHDFGRDEVELVYVYARHEGGSSSSSEAVNEALFSYAKREGTPVPFYLANIHETVGLLPENLIHQSPALLIVHNNVIQESFYGATAILDFIASAEAGEIDFAQFEH